MFRAMFQPFLSLAFVLLVFPRVFSVLARPLRPPFPFSTADLPFVLGFAASINFILLSSIVGALGMLAALGIEEVVFARRRTMLPAIGVLIEDLRGDAAISNWTWLLPGALSGLCLARGPVFQRALASQIETIRILAQPIFPVRL